MDGRFLNKILLSNRKSIRNILWQRILNLTPEALWVFVGQAGIAIAGLIGIKLLTHLLNPAEFGRLALANTIVALIGMNFFGPLGQGLMRFWAISKGRGNLDVFYAVSNCFAKYISLVVLLATVITAFVLAIIKDFDWTILVALSLVVAVFTGFLSLRISILTAARQRRRTAILTTSQAFLQPLIAIFLITLTVANANIVLIGYLLAAFFVLLIAELFYSQIVSELPLYRSKSSARALLFQGLGKEIFSFSLLFLVWGIFSWIKTFSDRWALQTFYGPEVVGAFAVISLLATYPLILGSGFLTTLFIPIAFQRAGDLTNSDLVASANRILAVMISIYVLGVVVLIGLFTMFHRPFVLLVSNVHFVEFSSLLPWLTIALAFYQLGEMLASFGVLVTRLQTYIIPKIISSIVAGIAIFWFSAKVGPIGIAWGFMVAGFVYTPWCAIKTWKLVKHS